MRAACPACCDTCVPLPHPPLADHQRPTSATHDKERHHDTDRPHCPHRNFCAPAVPDTLTGTVREFVTHWASVTRPSRIEVIDTSDDARLIEEALATGEFRPAGEGRYYARSHPKDSARSEERTVVATSDPASTTTGVPPTR